MILKSLNLCNASFREKALLFSGGVDSDLISSYLNSNFKRFNLSVSETNDYPITTEYPINKVNFDEICLLKHLGMRLDPLLPRAE